MPPRSVVRLGLAVLLGWQAIAPFAHLSQHALEHTSCPVTCPDSSDHTTASIATQPIQHACPTCQWLTSNPGLAGSLQMAAGADHTLIPAPLDQNATPSYPAFDFNVAVARGPPAFSLAAV
jgi:hypothetical protein